MANLKDATIQPANVGPVIPMPTLNLPPPSDASTTTRTSFPSTPANSDVVKLWNDRKRNLPTRGRLFPVSTLR